MKYLLMDGVLYIEDGIKSIKYNMLKGEWVSGGTDLNDARIGYDPYEPEDSPYRYGATDCLKDIDEISKEEAEKIIGKLIDIESIKQFLL